MSYKKPRPTRPLPTPVEQATTAREILQRGLDAGTVEADLVPKVIERIARIDNRLKELTRMGSSTRYPELPNPRESLSSPTFEMVAGALSDAGLTNFDNLVGTPFPTWSVINEDGYLIAQLWKPPSHDYWCVCRFIGGFNQGTQFGSLTEIAALVASWS